MIRFRKKKIEPTPAEIVQAERDKVMNSFNMFKKLKDDVAESNDKIRSAAKESEKRRELYLAMIENEEKTIATADDELIANNRLIRKLNEFIQR